MNNRIFLSSPTMNGREMEYIKEAFDTNWIAPLGVNVDGFEREIAAYVGVKDAAALSSGTAAIHLALRAAGVKPGDVVFSSALTFAATCNPIVYENAVPVFIDSEEESWNMSPAALKRAFEKYPHPAAVIVANLYGTPADLCRIRALCDEHDTVLIEDAAESLGASINGKQTGTFGKYGTLSFNGNKIITTSGGGMLLSDDTERIRKARFWATQSRDPARHYQHSELGFNYRMSNIVAGIGRGQLQTLPEYIGRKKALYEGYQKGFSTNPFLSMNPYRQDSSPNFWLSCIRISDHSPVSPDDIIDALEKENIESRPIWKPMELQPFYKDCDFFPHEEGKEPVGEAIFRRGLCLPSDIKMTKQDQDRVISIVNGLF